MEIYDEAQVKETKTKNITGLNSSLSLIKIYLWFALGLLLTGAVAIGLPFLIEGIYGGITEASTNTYYTILIVSLFIFLPTSLAVNFSSLSKHSGLIAAFYILFALSFGGVISFFTLLLPTETLFNAFLITSASFLLMGVLGYVTKGKIGAPILFLCAFVFGLSIISIFNLLLFNGSQYIMYYWIISIAILVIFLLIAAVDTNRIIRTAQNRGFDNSNTMVIYAAYCLYSDFMIIFYYVLRLLVMIGANRN